ncbi:hypothetical protein HDV04_002568 [Boothiomyces sp. JEL0838]|nr:hypothetical protein HDV04_002568 [Boothiomyces sp. JEL0838]
MQYNPQPAIDVNNILQTIALQTLQIQHKVLADSLPKPQAVMTDAQLRRERYRNFVIPKTEKTRRKCINLYTKTTFPTMRISKLKSVSLFVFAALCISKKYRNMIKNKLKKNEFELAIDEMADMVTNMKEYKLVMSDLRDLSQDTDFLIKEVGLGGLFAKKPSKSKIQAFTSVLDSLCKLITQTKYETLPQTVKQALFNIVKNENIPVGYLWDNESVLQASKNEEAWTITILYFFFVKTLIFKVVLTGYREKSATEEHNLRAISYIFYKCIRDSSSDGALEFEQQFKRGIQGWLGSSETANQWDDTGCKLLYKTFEVYMGEMANNMFQWAALMIEKVAPKDTLANMETIAETNDSKLLPPDSDTKPKE